jgi:hypothetical protein
MNHLLERKKSYPQGDLLVFPKKDCELPELRAYAAELLKSLKNGIVLILHPNSKGRWNLILHFSPQWVEKGFRAEKCLKEILEVLEKTPNVELWCKGKSNDFALGGSMAMSLPRFPEGDVESPREGRAELLKDLANLQEGDQNGYEAISKKYREQYQEQFNEARSKQEKQYGADLKEYHDRHEAILQQCEERIKSIFGLAPIS